MAEERVQRRLAAILAADMVGYSRLMEADEEGTVARQKPHRAELIDPKIADHHGRIVNRRAFAWPSRGRPSCRVGRSGACRCGFPC